MTASTFSPLFGETGYPSLPREGAMSRQSHLGSGQTSPTPVTAPQSPIEDDDDSEAATPLGLGSRNPFLASIIVARQTPSTGKGQTTSGTHSNRSTKTSSVRSKLKPGSFDEQTSRPGRAGNMQAHARTWPITSPSTEGRHSTSGNPLAQSLLQEPTPTATGSYSGPTPDTDAQTYGHKQERRSNSSRSSSNTSLSSLTSASGQRTMPEIFQYDWESVYPGFYPEETVWGNPRPMADSPPNPRYLGYYSGPATSCLIVGAGPGEANMGDVTNAWGD